MDISTIYTAFSGRIVMLGFGSVGQGVLPLLLRHIKLEPAQIEIVAPSQRSLEAVHEYGVRRAAVRLARDNYRQELSARLNEGDFLLNLSVDVSSKALMSLCQERRVLYVDACTEPWPGGYTDRSLPPAQRTNYALREDVLSLRRPGRKQTTALITMGANPGLISFLIKQALLELAGAGAAMPADRNGWADLARRLGVRVIHVAERDDQVSGRHKEQDEFVNTWSSAGFISESLQPAELGWGSHERELPHDGARHDSGCRAAIYLNRPGAGTRVRSWTPLAGPQLAYLITHAESISIADHLTLGDPARPDYRPTVHYAYHPSNDALLSLHELAGRQWREQKRKRLMRDDIVAGRDELGALLMGHEDRVFWYGSRLAIDEARALAPHNNATTLQVSAPIVAGMACAVCNPERGIVEPEDLPHDEMLAMIRPYLGEVVGVHGDWTPLHEREWLFDETVDRSDPWQFMNFRVDGRTAR
jgi:homospermidine synthase